MTQTNFDALYSQIESLPSLPAIVADVLEVTDDPESSAKDMMQAILPDQSMCAAILKIANSAFFGLPREVSTLEKAIMVLGFDEVQNIVLAKAVFNTLKDSTSQGKEAMEQLWEHSFTCALTAKILADRSNQSANELFILGLLHDIGKLAMLITFPAIYSHFLTSEHNNGAENCAQERELFFISHDDVARQMLDRWLFPQKLVATIASHHTPTKVDDCALAASTLQIADAVAHLDSHSQDLDKSRIVAALHNSRHEYFLIWQQHNLPCHAEEIKIWLDLLHKSKQEDTAILSIFTS
jgi:putative nucleotidyltransferase with HDIG domain